MKLKLLLLLVVGVALGGYAWFRFSQSAAAPPPAQESPEEIRKSREARARAVANEYIPAVESGNIEPLYGLMDIPFLTTKAEAGECLVVKEWDVVSKAIAQHGEIKKTTADPEVRILWARPWKEVGLKNHDAVLSVAGEDGWCVLIGKPASPLSYMYLLMRFRGEETKIVGVVQQ